MDMSEPLRVDVVFDFVCPWCYMSGSDQRKLLIRSDMPFTFRLYLVLERHFCGQNRCSKKRVDSFLSLRTMFSVLKSTL